METNWLRVAGTLAALGAVLLLWTARSPETESETSASVDGTAERGPDGLPLRPGASGASSSRPDLTLPGQMEAEAKARPQRVFRELNARRPPDLEADPHFQRLLEIDSARKMALLQEDPEELKQVRQQLLAEGAIPRHVLEGALLDSNPEVRLSALYEIELSMDEAPLDLLAPVLQGDPSAEVRLEALSMIAEVEGEDADALIQSALDDPDEGVSSEAQDILETRIDELAG